MTSTFKLGYGDHQHRLGFGTPEKPKQSLSEKHRPKQLSDMVGQGETVWRLESFLEAPYPAAFLFDGPTGVGKTTAALALASELGAVEFGGLEQIKSGMQDAEAVESVLRNCRFTPMLGSGWKVVIVDEADYMSVKASQLWLSALEDLPSKTVVVFTTNNPGKFADRFLDRCERFTFAADATTHMQDAQALVASIWQKEGLIPPCPDVNALAGVLDASGAISYRRVVRALEPLIARARSEPGPVVLREPDPEPARATVLREPHHAEAEIDAMIVAQVDAMLAKAKAKPAINPEIKTACTARSTLNFATQSKPALPKRADLAPIPFDDEPADNLESCLYALTPGITLEPPPAHKPKRFRYAHA